jgi:AraC-like DNA-binding protein
MVWLTLNSCASRKKNKPFKKEIMEVRTETLLDDIHKIQEYFRNKSKFELKLVLNEKTKTENPFIEKAKLLIEKNFDNSEFGINTLMSEFNMSQSSLFKKIKKQTKMSPTRFIRSVRLEKATRLISEDNSLMLKSVALEVGFNDYSYFKKSFKQYFGYPPSEYKNLTTLSVVI